nr:MULTISPECIES: tripartite tricarboxylate transporter substrate binding protein [Ramlibacter]
MRRRTALATAGGAALLAVPAFHAAAQQYPARPVKILVPYAPGGAVDIFARLLAKEFATLNGQAYVVENKGGAGGAIAAAEVARSTPDGYTVLFGATGPNAIVPAVYGPATGFDPVKDLVPVTLLASMPYVLVVHPALPVRGVADLVAYARANPGKLNYASSGNGGPDHLAGELFKLLGNLNVVHVPYKGSGPALADLAGGQVQYLFTSPLVAMPLVDSGKVRVIGMTGLQRNASLANLPAIAETLPGFELSSWYGLFVPAGTPAAVVARLNADARRITASDEFRDAVRKRGVDAQASSPEEFGAYVRAELAKWSRVVKDAGIRSE